MPLKPQEVQRFTCSSSNWSPPNAATQGLIPPVPKAMRIRPTMERALKHKHTHEEKKNKNHRLTFIFCAATGHLETLR